MRVFYFFFIFGWLVVRYYKTVLKPHDSILGLLPEAP